MDKMYAITGSELELDEAIVRLKQLGSLVTITDLLTTKNMSSLVEMLQIIERINIPIRMGSEGQA